MALTDEDLDRIDARTEKTVERVVDRVINHRGLATKADLAETEASLGSWMDRMESKMERMESRILFGMSLLERDGVDTLEDHERRIRRLEQIQTS